MEMCGNLMLLGILATIYVLPVAGIQLSFSEQNVLPAEGSVTLTCSVNEAASRVYSLQIGMFQGSTVVSLGLLELGGHLTSAIPPAFTNRMSVSGSLDQTTPTNSMITLTIDKTKILCSDGTIYECEVSYRPVDDTVPKVSSQNITLEVYENPLIKSLEGRLNGIVVEGPTGINKAQFQVGDQLVLTCEANIGSIESTQIQWRRTSDIGQLDTFIEYNPPLGTYSETEPVKVGCGYTRQATIKYNMTLADANRQNNLGFECYVRVSSSPYNGYETATDTIPKFYAEVAGGTSGNQEAVVSAENPSQVVAGAVGGSVSAIVGIAVVVGVVVCRRRVGQNASGTEQEPQTRHLPDGQSTYCDLMKTDTNESSTYSDLHLYERPTEVSAYEKLKGADERDRNKTYASLCPEIREPSTKEGYNKT